MIRVLFVCTGNICRSPMAVEALRLHRDEAPLIISSAGTYVVGPRPMTDEAQRVVEAFGGSGDEHRSRPLRTQTILRANLILTATREHRRAVVHLAPSRVRSTFTIREFERLANGVSDDALRTAVETVGGSAPDRLEAVLRTLSGARPHTIPASAGDDDIDDPIGQSAAVYERVGAQIVAATAATARVLHWVATPHAQPEASEIVSI